MTAPFGLTWGASAEEVRANHVQLEPMDAYGPNGVSFLADNVPKPIADVSTIVLFFSYGDKLWRIVASLRGNPNDPFGNATLNRYNELKALLSKRYGNAVESKHTDEYCLDKNYVFGLSTGQNFLYSDFDTKELIVQLGVRSAEVDESHCILFYEDKTLKQEFEIERHARESDAL